MWEKMLITTKRMIIRLEVKEKKGRDEHATHTNVRETGPET